MSKEEDTFVKHLQNYAKQTFGTWKFADLNPDAVRQVHAEGLRCLESN